MHNGTEHTVETLAGLLENIKNKGYKIVPVSELIYKDGYTIDQSGKQYKNKNGE